MKELIIITEHIEKCLHILAHDKHNNEEVLKALFGGTGNLYSNYINPFRRELDRNMLTRRTLEEKKDLIIYYISELMRVQGRMREFKDIEIQAPNAFIDLYYKNGTASTSIVEQFSVHRHYLYVLLFNEIQKCCFNFKIPFLNICRELWFPLQVIDIEISMDYEELSTGARESEEQNLSTINRLRTELKAKDFFKLKFVLELSDPAKEKLVWFINTNELPYQIAMFDFLGFIVSAPLTPSFPTSATDLPLLPKKG